MSPVAPMRPSRRGYRSDGSWEDRASWCAPRAGYRATVWGGASWCAPRAGVTDRRRPWENRAEPARLLPRLPLCPCGRRPGATRSRSVQRRVGLPRASSRARGRTGRRYDRANAEPPQSKARPRCGRDCTAWPGRTVHRPTAGRLPGAVHSMAWSGRTGQGQTAGGLPGGPFTQAPPSRRCARWMRWLSSAAGAAPPTRHARTRACPSARCAPIGARCSGVALGVPVVDLRRGRSVVLVRHLRLGHGVEFRLTIVQ